MGTTSRLSARGVAALTKPGRYADGGGLYLTVGPSGSRSWIVLATIGGRRRELGLGSARDVTLAAARQRAAAIRAAIAEGRDPLAEKRKAKASTFGAFAEEMINEWTPHWRSPRSAPQWHTSLRTHASALLSMPLDSIDTPAVLGVLQPIWQSLPETASRVRGRIEKILDAARVRGLRSGENPARWRGHLDHLLKTRAKHTRGHRAALPFDDVPGFMAQLAKIDNVASDALQFSILTAARSKETLGATWNEIDFDKAVWSLPAERMKALRPHRVSLADASIAILMRRKAIAGMNPYVFASRKTGRPMFASTLSDLVHTLGTSSVPHGFRSSFRDWASERTSFPREVAELCLAHVTASATERAYARSDLITRRRELLSAWASFATGAASGTVVPFTQRG